MRSIPASSLVYRVSKLYWEPLFHYKCGVIYDEIIDVFPIRRYMNWTLFRWQTDINKSGAALIDVCSLYYCSSVIILQIMKTTNLTHTSGMVVVTNIAELKGVNRVFGGATFKDGDIVEIPESPQLQKFVRPNGKTRIEIGLVINGKEKWINLASFINLPMEGEGEGFKDDFLSKHPVNAEIAVGDAADQVTKLIELKKLKVSKVKANSPVLTQDQNGAWSRKKDDKGNDLIKVISFSVFEKVTE